MENKSHADRPIEENVVQESDNMENDEVMSGGPSAAVTENADLNDRAAADKVLEPSQIQSEPTSGIDMVYSTSASEMPCEGLTTDAEEKKPVPSPLTSEPTSGIEMISRSTTSASEIPCEGVETSDTEKKPERFALPIEPRVELGSACTTASQAPSERVSGTNYETDANVTTSPPKKSIFGKAYSTVKKVLSPTKSGKSKLSPSKSMSPSKETPPTDSDNVKPVSGEARVPSESEEHSKKGSENKGMFSRLKRKLSKLKISKSSERANFVSDEETDQTEEPRTSKLDKLPEPIWSDLQASVDLYKYKPQWTKNRTSLTERPSIDATTTTDVPSTCSSADILPSDSSKKSSEIGDNTSEEAVAGSLVSSPDEEIPDIRKDKDDECVKKDGPSTDQKTQNVVEAESFKENQSTAEHSPYTYAEKNTVAQNSMENQGTATDGSRTVEGIKNVVEAENSKENLYTTKDGPGSTDQESGNVVMAENSKENLCTAKNGPTSAESKNIVAAENSNENKSTAKDTSTDEKTTNEVVVEKSSTAKD